MAKRLWALANWARYVRPGAIRVGASGGTGVKTAAFKNVDGSIAVVAISTGASASSVSIKISGATPKAVEAYVSDNTHNCEKTTASVAEDGTISGSVAGRSITTFFVPAGSSTATTS